MTLVKTVVQLHSCLRRGHLENVRWTEPQDCKRFLNDWGRGIVKKSEWGTRKQETKNVCL